MPSKEYRASTTINAAPEKVWDILTATDEWPEWDPYCEKIEGEVELGKKIKAFTKLAPGRAFPVKVVELVENERMTWQGGMPLGLFTGVRTFTLQAKNGAVEFTLTERFSGPMLALFGGSIPDMTEPFNKFVEGLKDRAEA